MHCEWYKNGHIFDESSVRVDPPRELVLNPSECAVSFLSPAAAAAAPTTATPSSTASQCQGTRTLAPTPSVKQAQIFVSWRLNSLQWFWPTLLPTPLAPRPRPSCWATAWVTATRTRWQSPTPGDMCRLSSAATTRASTCGSPHLTTATRSTSTLPPAPQPPLDHGISRQTCWRYLMRSLYIQAFLVSEGVPFGRSILFICILWDVNHGAPTAPIVINQKEAVVAASGSMEV